MKRKFTVFTVIALCIASIAVGAVASSVIQEIHAQLRPDFVIEIDGQVREFKNAQGEVVYPILYNGTTYLPVRAIGELMGKTVVWHENEKRVELKDYTVTDADIIVDGLPSTTDADKKPVEIADSNIINTEKFIGAEKAKDYALAKAGLNASEVIFDRVEIDEDNGVWHYDVEFRKGYTEYDVEVKADDGTVISFEKDIDG